jgi:autotransporter-associated beta strand protein
MIGGELFATSSFTLNANRQIFMPGGVSPSGGTFDATGGGGGSGQVLTIAGNISGPAAFTKGSNNSTVILLGSNSYGGTSVLGGTLQIGAGTTGATIGTGAISNAAALVFNHSDSLTVGGAITGAGSLTQTGTGTLVLTNTGNTFTGGSFILNGELSIAADTNIGGASSSITFGGGVLQITGNSLTTLAPHSINASGFLGGFDIASATNTFTFPQSLVNSGGLKKLGPGTLILTGIDAFTGVSFPVSISGGSLQIGAGTTSGSINADVNDNAALVFDHSDTVAFTRVIAGSGSVTQLGSGTLALSGSNSYTGGTILRAGELSIGTQSNIGGASTSMTFSGGILQIIGTSIPNLDSHTLNNTTFNGGFDEPGSNDQLVVSQALSGPGSLTKIGFGSLILTGSNSYSGTTTISSGTVQVGNGGAGARIGTGTISDSTALVFNHSGSLTVSANITGAGSVTQTGTGLLLLSGSNSYLGGTFINGGTLSATTANGLGTNGITFNGGVYQYQPGTSFDVTTHAVTIGGSGGGVDTNGNNVTFGNALGGVGQFIKYGAGSLTFGKSNGYSGGTSVQGGKLITSFNFTNGQLTIGATGIAQVLTQATSNSAAGSTFVPALSITSPGTLDLTNNALIIDYTGASPLLPIERPLITSGYNNGAWTGSGITSSSAASVAALSANIHKTALGYADASTLGIGTFAGHSLDGTDVIVAYALSGDANLDGQVNTMDFTALASHFNSGTQLWTSGDFNFDGKVNALDFNAIATNFGATFTSPPLGALVPEPAALITIPLVALLAPRRRRRFNLHRLASPATPMACLLRTGSFELG